MFHKKKQTTVLLLISAAIAAMSGCASSPARPAQPEAVSGTRYQAYRWGKPVEKYTKADYDFLLSFQTEGYGKLPVEEFNHKVLNWEDEEEYHKTEDILARVSATLSEEDENADFILVTLGNTWNECEKKHFNTCEREKAPWHSSQASYETYGDVFGDKVLLTGAYADFSFDYNLDTDQKLTVRERDDLLDSIGNKLEEYMMKQQAGALKEEEKMEKTLSSHLTELLKSLDGGITWGGNADLDYYWDTPYDFRQDNGSEATDVSSEDSFSYTKKQYNLVMERFKPQNYEQMSVSEYNRTIYNAFIDDTGDEEGTGYAYEMVMASLSENDKNWTYLHDTVQRALDEYHTRMTEVYTGEKTDFCCTGDIYVPLIEDVYGDKVEVGSVDGQYEFTYRITDAAKLTVQEREEFINKVNQKVKELAEKEAGKGTLDEAGFKKLLESAGEEASTQYIEFTGCSLGYFEVYR